jgi:transcriptional regulator with PAS, ATPase and Fis domain
MKLDQMKLFLIRRALKKFSGNRTLAAAELEISLRTLRNWIRKFNLQLEFPPRSAPGSRRKES